MKFILLYYLEVTHTEPYDWWPAEEHQITPAVDGFLIDHPDGVVKVMSEATFKRTTYGKSVYGKAVE
jgi:hypothetical protein